VIRGSRRRQGVLASNFLSLVTDNALWLNTGPIDGSRWNLTAGVVSDITHGVFENWIGSADYRRYVRTSMQSALSFRGYLYASEGTRPRAVAIGGSWMLRGYPRFSQAGTRAWMGNAEWRFPITNFVALGFPFGTVRFPEVQGAIFSDFGQSWERSRYDDRILASAGVGFRMPVIPGFVFRLDVGRRFSLNSPRVDPRASYYDRRFLDFFFGYNY
jgi:hemolysin activation/secretion protein